MTTNKAILREAQSLLRLEDRKAARKLLSDHLHDHPGDVQGWMLLSRAVSSKQEQQYCLENALAVDPDYTPAKKAMDALKPRWWGRLRLGLAVVVFGLLLPAATWGGALIALEIWTPGAVAASPAELAANAAVVHASNVQPALIKTFETSTESGDPGSRAEAIPLPNIPAAFCVPEGNQRETGEVLAVTAPDEIAVILDGEIATVRYIGLDVAGLNDVIGAQALLTNQSLQGVTVTLVAGNEQPDGDGALRRYVFAGDYFINFQLLEWGLALVSEEGLDEACAGFFLAAQNQASEQKIGQWAPVDVRMDPSIWQQWPVVPRISENALNIYKAGIALGNDPHKFTIYGDCQSLSWRLFQRMDWDGYDLGPDYAFMEPTRLWYTGSFGRNPITTADGATVASMFSVPWANPHLCNSGETPFECEMRVYNPSVALITLGTNWTGTPEEFEYYLRKLVGDSVAEGVLPVIVTKVDGGPYWELNHVMARVSYEYDVPLWNFWLAAQGLPNGGMDIDDPKGIHFVDDAFPIKRITGLMTLHAILTAAGQ
jgi:endonuclease YncB( thermonuclease family)